MTILYQLPCSIACVPFCTEQQFQLAIYSCYFHVTTIAVSGVCKSQSWLELWPASKTNFTVGARLYYSVNYIITMK